MLKLFRKKCRSFISGHSVYSGIHDKAHVRHTTRSGNFIVHNFVEREKFACLTWRLLNFWWVAQVIFWIKIIFICRNFSRNKVAILSWSDMALSNNTVSQKNPQRFWL